MQLYEPNRSLEAKGQVVLWSRVVLNRRPGEFVLFLLESHCLKKVLRYCLLLQISPLLQLQTKVAVATTIISEYGGAEAGGTVLLSHSWSPLNLADCKIYNRNFVMRAVILQFSKWREAAVSQWDSIKSGAERSGGVCNPPARYCAPQDSPSSGGMLCSAISAVLA